MDKIKFEFSHLEHTGATAEINKNSNPGFKYYIDDQGVIIDENGQGAVLAANVDGNKAAVIANAKDVIKKYNIKNIDTTIQELKEKPEAKKAAKKGGKQ